MSWPSAECTFIGTAAGVTVILLQANKGHAADVSLGVRWPRRARQRKHVDARYAAAGRRRLSKAISTPNV
jgi:hypothetical protein